MNRREKLLAGVVLLLVVLWGGSYAFEKYSSSLRSRNASVDTARTKLQEANRRLRLGRQAAQQMKAWQEQALPANYEKALSLYKAWLLAKANEAGLNVADIKLLPTGGNSTAYKAFAYQIVAKGSLSSVTSMLYEFYRSPQLHQVTNLQLIRPAGSPQLDVTLSVEALSLRGAVATDKLPEGDSKRLKLASADAYKKSLSERDIVSAYSPPRPPTPPRERREPTAPPKFDDSEFAVFTGTSAIDDEMQAWINVRTTGKTMFVVSGDAVKVGALEGQIVSVESQALVYKTGDKKFRVPLGQSLRKGKEIDAKGEAKTAPVTEPPKS